MKHIALFGDSIVAQQRPGRPMIDLHSLCDAPADYSDVLAIEPSTTISGKEVLR